MSHSYYLRPNAGGRMQRQLDSHVAAFGEQDRDKIVAVPSNTGLGVHLYFDPERSLSPDPEQAANRQSTDSSEGVIVVDDADSESSLSDLGSDLETVAPDTPPCGQVWPSSHLHAPRAPRHIKQDNRPAEGSVGSSTSVHDSLALVTERKKKAPKAHLDGDVEDCLSVLEQDHQKMIDQARNKEERLAEMKRAYEGTLEQFRRENAAMFIPAEGVSEYFESLSPEPFEHGDLPSEVSHPTFPQSAGPSRGEHVKEDRKQYQQYTPLRHRNDLPFTVSSRDEAAESVGADGQLVVVARRVQKRGPCGTVVLDHDTGGDELVTKCYRVREEELFSIDGDGDSVMGSDDSHVL